jgi:hypothetical protein
MEPWMVCATAADLHHFNVEQDPGPHELENSDPDQHQSDEDSQHSIRIKIQALLNPDPIRIWNRCRPMFF